MALSPTIIIDADSTTKFLHPGITDSVGSSGSDE
jgi:hypothetical protein